MRTWSAAAACWRSSVSTLNARPYALCSYGCCRLPSWNSSAISWFVLARVHLRSSAYITLQRLFVTEGACLSVSLSVCVSVCMYVCGVQQRHGNDRRLTPRIFFSAFWYSLHADNIDLRLAFTCPVCGSLTEAPCCVWDAVKAAIEFKQLRGRLPLMLRLFREQYGGAKRVGTRQASRLCIADAGVRRLLRRWCEVQRHSQTDTESAKGKPLSHTVRSDHDHERPL